MSEADQALWRPPSRESVDSAFARQVGVLEGLSSMRPPDSNVMAQHFWRLVVEEAVGHSLTLLALESFREKLYQLPSELRGGSIVRDFVDLRRSLKVLDPELRL